MTTTIPVGSGGSGTVTSVALTVPGGLSVAGSPITTSGTLAVTTALSGILKASGGTISAAVSGTDYQTPQTTIVGYGITDAARHIGTPGRVNATCTGSGFQTLSTQAIAGGILGSSGAIRAWYYVRRTTGTGTATVRIQYGGTTVFGTVAPTAGNSAAFLITFTLWGNGATNAQRGIGQLLPHVSSLTGAYSNSATAAVDSTTSQNLTLDIDLGTDSDVFTLDAAGWEVL